MPWGWMRKSEALASLSGLVKANEELSQLALLLGTSILHCDNQDHHRPAVETWQHWMAFGQLPKKGDE